MMLMDVWATEPAARGLKCEHYYHALGNPIFRTGELHWLRVISFRLGGFLLSAQATNWAPLDKDFIRSAPPPDLEEEDSDLD